MRSYAKKSQLMLWNEGRSSILTPLIIFWPKIIRLKERPELLDNFLARLDSVNRLTAPNVG